MRNTGRERSVGSGHARAVGSDRGGGAGASPGGAVSAARRTRSDAAAVHRREAVRAAIARARRRDVRASRDPRALDIDEYEQAHDLEPGLDRIAAQLVDELGKLVRGEPHALSQHAARRQSGVARGARRRGAAGASSRTIRSSLIAPLALSRSQDDKGNDRWTLFGASHDGGAACWRGFDEARLAELVAWAGLGDWRVHGDDVPPALHGRRLGDVAAAHARHVHAVRAAARARARRVPRAASSCSCRRPASLVLVRAPALPRARARSCRARRRSRSCTCSRASRAAARSASRSPAGSTRTTSATATASSTHLERRHRWQRVARDAALLAPTRTHDKVSVALFSTDPVSVDLYDKPLARNAQVWTDDYRAAARRPARRSRGDPRAPRRRSTTGGRFGYRMYYPPMRAGVREVFWHYPLVAGAARAVARGAAAATSPPSATAAMSRIELAPRLLARRAPRRRGAAVRARPGPRAPHDQPQRCASCSRRASCSARRSRRRSRARCSTSRKHDTLEDWLAELPAHASIGTPRRGSRDAARRGRRRRDPGEPLVLERPRHARVRGADLVDDRAPRARRVSPEERRRRHRGQPRQARRPGGEGGARRRRTSGAISRRSAITCTPAIAR